MTPFVITIWSVGFLFSSSLKEDSTIARYGELRARSTLHSVGIEWDITGDSNHNATCSIRFRKHGDIPWRAASLLLRIDYRGRYYGAKVQAFRHFNMLSGSVMFLEPATSYEFELTGRDPDGGKIAARSRSVVTTHSPT